ncbi:putative Alpha-glucan, water dikinase [uncultured Desulfobacterium sp.]|uniref:Putative Alpha-glucan, water dikinase n=1 Tax=uncultured Desulfobacterium sp. TaxID=201089 RepID=A0A445MZH5_9BACT|nr:putative Alpha-glucan, water dikinase [uncultured Desulfobacterium sp.]
MTTENILTRSGLMLLVNKQITETGVEVIISTDAQRKVIFHWGFRHRGERSWVIPDKSLWPEQSRPFGDKALQSPFLEKDGKAEVLLKLNDNLRFPLIGFVLFFPDDNLWDNNHGQDYLIEIPSRSSSTTGQLPTRHIDLDDIFKRIVERETGVHSWTLMHRFNLCYDLLDDIRDDPDGLSLVYVWLRYSAIRQLDWQRNYNTQPRELSHALDRLTNKFSDLYMDYPPARHHVRLILTNLGRGGEGQRVRDEILNIMHRHHIKEVSGHFMEEWHQKLHNNTTPDDVVICEAYLAFLRSDGNMDLFYKRLAEGGVTRERLTGYDRPIRSQPDFIPHLKDALIHDFGDFLGVLKGVHSGTDLGAAIQAARYLFDNDMHTLMDYIWSNKDSGPDGLFSLLGWITEGRRQVALWLKGHRDGVRDMLFLDLALEDYLRVAVERSLHFKWEGNRLARLIAVMMDNMALTDDDVELNQCRIQWRLLGDKPKFDQHRALKAQSVLERLGRMVNGTIDQYYKLLQPKAELMGKAFNADSWTITLFTEEVVRGRPAFVLVMLLRHLNPILRKSAVLGNWQVVSQGKGMGQVEEASSLESIKYKSFVRPTIIITDKIVGNEEIPQGVTAIITPDTTDIVSHVAIRARNAQVLIATCYDTDTLEHLRSLRGQVIGLTVNAAGEVEVKKGEQDAKKTSPKIRPVRILASRPEFSSYAISERDFSDRTVGGKANHLKRLRVILPGWIGLPISVAMPFGVFEQVLYEKINEEAARQYDHLTKKADDTAVDSVCGLLGDLKAVILGLKAPDALRSSLQRVNEDAGLIIENWAGAWECIKKVWGSKWNERAFLSRRAQGILHRDLFMSVLIQEVIEADYSFVIHTINPFTSDRDEIYAEAVPGLGETLVGNYPGRAFSFSMKKGKKTPHLHAFPSKSIGLFGNGLIFRSDSNGEDLVDYAGAGLYDSVMLQAPTQAVLDYSKEPLVWDEEFQREFCIKVAAIGVMVEKLFGYPQDIEGVYSNDRYYVVQTRPQVGINGD